jgi:hypothetical protein
MMVVGAWDQLRSRDIEMGSHFDIFLFLSSLLLFVRSRPGINGVGMGCYQKSMDVELPRAPDLTKGRH